MGPRRRLSGQAAVQRAERDTATKQSARRMLRQVGSMPTEDRSRPNSPPPGTTHRACPVPRRSVPSRGTLPQLQATEQAGGQTAEGRISGQGSRSRIPGTHGRRQLLRTCHAERGAPAAVSALDAPPTGIGEWFTLASSAPAVLIALIAERTERIRVGSGAVQTGHQLPVVIADPSRTSPPSSARSATGR
jgi:hypothetical protein